MTDESYILIGGGIVLLMFVAAAWLDDRDHRAEMGVRTAHDQYRQRNAVPSIGEPVVDEEVV